METLLPTTGLAFLEEDKAFRDYLRGLSDRERQLAIYHWNEGAPLEEIAVLVETDLEIENWFQEPEAYEVAA